MSIQCVAWVLDESPTIGSDRLVLIALANHAGPDGTNAHPGFTTIAREARVSRSTVIRSILALEQAGAIKVTRPELTERGSRGGRRSNLYEVVMGTPSPVVVVEHLSQRDLEALSVESLNAALDHEWPDVDWCQPDTSAAEADRSHDDTPGVAPRDHSGVTGDTSVVPLVTPEPSLTVLEPSFPVQHDPSPEGDETGAGQGRPSAETDDDVVAKAIDILAHRLLDQQTPGSVRTPGAWLHAKRFRLVEEHDEHARRVLALHPNMVATDLVKVLDGTRRLQPQARVSEPVERLPKAEEVAPHLDAARAALRGGGQ